MATDLHFTNREMTLEELALFQQARNGNYMAAMAFLERRALPPATGYDIRNLPSSALPALFSAASAAVEVGSLLVLLDRSWDSGPQSEPFEGDERVLSRFEAWAAWLDGERQAQQPSS